MEWHDQGLVISARRHGERDAILEVMTAAHGRHLGMVRAGRSPRQAPVLQPGNRLQLTWRARLEDHLGHFSAELIESRAGALMSDALALHVVTHLSLLMRQMPERASHARVFEAADALLSLLGAPALVAPLLVRFELLVLAELGFGLDLGCCAVTGAGEDLVYVSPRTGRAVSREAGAPYAARLLRLPAFLLPPHDPPDARAVEAGFSLAGFFLERHLFEPRGLRERDSRTRAVAGLLARAGISAADATES